MTFRILSIVPLVFLIGSNPLLASDDHKTTFLKGSVKHTHGFLSHKKRSSQAQQTLVKQSDQAETASIVHRGHLKRSGSFLSSMFRAEIDGPIHGITGNSR
jgi:hypothetical protein